MMAPDQWLHIEQNRTIPYATMGKPSGNLAGYAMLLDKLPGFAANLPP